MSQPPSVGPVETFLEHSSGNWTWRGNKPRLSLYKGSLSALAHTSLFRLFKLFSKMFSQQHLCERDVYIGEEEEVGIPQMVEGRHYPLGGCPKVGNKKLKEDVRHYSVEQLMPTPLTKWLEMENLLLYLKENPKTSQRRQSTETECQWARGPVLISFIGTRP